MAPDWNAAAYDQVASPQTGWGARVVGWLELAGHERVLDAGCGTGRVTALLLEPVSRGHVIALDASPAMIRQAKTNLAPFGDRVSYLVADLLEPIPVQPPVDAIISTATFHWIADHDRLFNNLAAVLRPGGQLCAQCGGKGNIATVEAALHELDRDLGVTPFPTAEKTLSRLRAAGFTDVECWLQEEPTSFGTEGELETFLATVVLRCHVHSMPEEEARTFVHDVAARLPSRRLDYVRLNIRARRAA